MSFILFSFAYQCARVNSFFLEALKGYWHRLGNIHEVLWAFSCLFCFGHILFSNFERRYSLLDRNMGSAQAGHGGALSLFHFNTRNKTELSFDRPY